MLIPDTIFERIELRDEEKKIELQPEIKRLTRINQLGLVYLAPQFSSATHTRYHHTLGVLYLAGKIGGYLSLTSDQIRALRISALLHDVGHGPFSHFSEKILGWRGVDVAHEDISADVIRKSENIGRVWREYTILPDRNMIADIVCNKSNEHHILAKILSNDIDIDRIDYLLRDLKFTNLGYSLDYERLLQGFYIYKTRVRGQEVEDVVIREDYSTDANFLLLTRVMLRPHVYYEPLHRAAELLIFDCLQQTMARRGDSRFNQINNDGLKEELFCKMDDSVMLSELEKASSENSDLIQDIKKGNVCNFHTLLKWSELSPYIQDEILRADTSNLPYKELINLSSEIGKQLSASLTSLGITGEEVFVDIPKLETLQEASMKVLTSKREVARLDEFSPLAKSLKEAYKELWSLLVFVRKKDRRRLSTSKEKKIGERIREFFS